MSVKEKELGGHLSPRADELSASFQCFVAAVEQKNATIYCTKLRLKLISKVKFKKTVKSFQTPSWTMLRVSRGAVI